ncbi:Ppx/GppA phosphatase family protein [Pedobacter rhizosphaerae]|uniref:Exopolyphosphatase / guanosine-5'-triphosphate,3'-diphosphate pyrophosphatase n=1 Tax=Pedobacter rhizosphaerae TaxID=390241 RepID=A0A1H9MVN8_9SPHI|nr:exopolyphosphatase [Pedobacter rhizosphaerae]SER27776.1 exopolyphosphatase / guanosine-5'-triphosphate,3'-diphosphate pyrophosphatase [Pedobacter rhizosphaerae]
MRFAAIDLGTNTFHLLIAEVKNSSFEILYKTNVPVKLGEGRINENIIIPAAFERGLNTLKSFDEIIQKYDVDQVRATATSAVRSAENGQDFVSKVKEHANITIEAISGDEEAELIYQGVKLSGAIQERALIMDIGGGSVEFILCDQQSLIWKKSYNIGAARLMQQFFHSNPISDEDKGGIVHHIQNQLTDLFEICEIHQPQVLIGSAGAFETFAELITQKKNQTTDIKNVKTFNFEFDDYIATAIELINATHDQRAAMKGMIPLRVDMIVIAALITNYVMGRIQLNKLVLSTYDLKMGLLSQFINKQ